MFRVCVMMVVVVGDGKSGWGSTICYVNEDYDHKGKLVTMLAYILARNTAKKCEWQSISPSSVYKNIHTYNVEYKKTALSEIRCFRYGVFVDDIIGLVAVYATDEILWWLNFQHNRANDTYFMSGFYENCLLLATMPMFLNIKPNSINKISRKLILSDWCFGYPGYLAPSKLYTNKIVSLH